MKNTQKTEVAATESQEIFDIQKVRRFIQMMRDYDLTELELRQGDMAISLKRGGVPSPAVLPAAPAAPAAAIPAAPAPPAAKDESHLALITSPLVGTYYSKPDPNSPAYISLGDVVGPEKTVCIVEAMKVFNQIPAKISGKIVAILAKDGDAVEFGQPLFKVDTRG